MSSEPPVSLPKAQSPLDLFTMILMLQKGMIDSKSLDVILPMLSQLSDHLLTKLNLSSKTIKSFDREEAEKFAFILKTLKSEHSANDLLKETTSPTSSKEVTKILKEYIKEWAEKLKESSKQKETKEEITQHVVTKGESFPKKVQPFSQFMEKREMKGKDNPSVLNSGPAGLEESLLKEKVSEREIIKDSGLEKKPLLQKENAQKQDLNAKSPEPKVLEPKTLKTLNEKEHPVNRQNNLPTEQNIPGKLQSPKDVISSQKVVFEEAFQASGESLSETKASTSSSINNNIGAFPMPFHKKNTIVSYLNKEKMNNKKVQKKEEARNNLDEDKELNYFKEDDEES